MKWIRRLAVVLILLLALIAAGVIFKGGALIKRGVETVGPKVTGVP